MERLTKEKLMTINTAYTHAGVFHADDVFSTALLELMKPDINIERVFEVPEGAELAFDIGGGLYDHHQEGSEVRENGVPYAAFGLLWRDLGAEFLESEEEAKIFDETFVQSIDNTDNTGDPNPLSLAINTFNPSWDVTDDGNCFRQAVEMAVEILVHFKMRTASKLRAVDIVEDARKKSEDGIVVLPVFAPWQSVLVQDWNCVFVVFPSNRGGYNLQVIPRYFDTRDPKVPMPESWLTEAPTGCSFVHKGLFIAAFDTVENAMSAAKEAISKYERPIWDDPKFDREQQDEIRYGLEKGLDVSVYAKPEFSARQMVRIRYGLERGLDVSVYAKPEFSAEQMTEIIAGLTEKLDVSICTNPEFSAGWMTIILNSLRDGIDASVYKPSMTPDEIKTIARNYELAQERKVSIQLKSIRKDLGEEDVKIGTNGLRPR